MMRTSHVHPCYCAAAAAKSPRQGRYRTTDGATPKVLVWQKLRFRITFW